MAETLPSTEPATVTPLKVVPKTKKDNPVTSFISTFLILLIIFGLVYGFFYSASAGWHDGGY